MKTNTLTTNTLNTNIPLAELPAVAPEKLAADLETIIDGLLTIKARLRHILRQNAILLHHAPGDTLKGSLQQLTRAHIGLCQVDTLCRARDLLQSRDPSRPPTPKRQTEATT